MRSLQLMNGGWGAVVPLSVAIGVYMFFVFLPGMHEIRELRADIATKQSAVAAARAVPQRLSEIAQQTTETHRYIAQWRGPSADPQALAKSYGRISQLLKDCELTPTMFRPEAKRTWTELECVPVTIGCRGTSSQITKLLALIEKLPQRIWIENVMIERSRQDAGFVECELRLAIFVDKFEISN